MGVPLNSLAALAWAQVWQVTAVALAVGALAWLAGRRRPHLAYVLWLLVVAKCLTPPIWSSPAGVFSWVGGRIAERSESEALPEVSALASPPTEIALSGAAVPDASRNIAAQPPDALAAAPQTAGPEVETQPLENPTRHWSDAIPASTALGVLWLCGAMVCLAVAAARTLCWELAIRRSRLHTDGPLVEMVARLSKRLGIRRRVRVCVTPRPLGPATAGIARPVVLVPELLVSNRSDRQMELIVAHELIHVRRNDAAVGLVQLLTQCLWWFHPLVWWANRAVCRERERCCDAEVVGSLGCLPSQYAQGLLDVLRLERQLASVAVLPGMHPFQITRMRLETVMNPAIRVRGRMPFGYWLVLLAGMLVLLPGAAVIRGGETPSPDPSAADAPAVSAPADAAPSVASPTVQSEQGQTLAANAAPAAILTPEAKAASDAERYSGVVFDPAGVPAAGCRVWLFNAGPPWKGDVVEETVTGPDGAFALRTPWRAPEPDGKRLALFVRDAKGRIGFPDRPNWGAKPGQVRFQLMEVATFRGRLVDASGRPLANVRVRPTVFDNVEFGKRLTWLAPLPRILSEEMGVRTAADGTFVLQGLPIKGTISMKIAVDEYCNLDSYWAPGKPVTIALDREGTISGTVVAADSAAAEGRKLCLAWSGRDPYEGRDYRLVFYPAAVTQKGGQFRITHVIPGRYQLLVEDADQSYSLDPQVLEVKAGQALSGIKVQLDHLVAVAPAARSAAYAPGATGTQGTVKQVAPPSFAPALAALEIRGLWRAVSLEQDDQRASGEAIRQLVFVIDEKTIAIHRGTDLVAKTEYKLDAKQNPPVVSLTYDGQPTQGICRIQGDRLQFCLADVGQARPKKFIVGPEGGKMALVLQSAEGERRPLYVMGVDGKDVRCLVSLPEYTATGSPEWSCDGKRIAFDACRSVFGEGFSPYSHVFVANADGTGARDLGDGAMPSWSPDGKRLAISRYGEHQGVWLINADGTGAELVDNAGWGIQWCPKGNRVAYTTYGDGVNICVRDLGKSEGRALLTRSYQRIYWGMCWSPDGQWIAFKGIKADGQAELAAVHVDGEAKGFKVLLPKDMTRWGFLATVAWGGDGKRVMTGVRGPGGKVAKLYFLDFAQKAPPQLVPGQDPAWSITGMSWSLDGKKILFNYVVPEPAAPPSPEPAASTLAPPRQR